MKKNRKKNMMAIYICVVLCLMNVIVLSPEKPVTLAAEKNVSVGTIAMKEGASVRLTKNEGAHKEKKGIRFTMFINKEYYEKLTKDGTTPEVGMYLCKASEMGTGNLISETEIPASAKHVKAQVFAGDDSETTEETKSFNVVLYNIPVEDYNTSVSANGYIVVDGKKVFAANPQTRSVAQVASKALQAGYTDTDYYDYVDPVVTGENFKFADASIRTDLYQTAEPELGLTLPENLSVTELTSRDPEIVSVDTDGKLKRGTKLGTATITATLGNATREATVTVGEPVVAIAEEGATAISSNDDFVTKERAYFAKGTEEIANFTGDYKGNAIRMTNYNGFNLTVENRYTKDELEQISKDYDSVSLWLAVDIKDSNEWLAFTEEGGGGFMTMAAGNKAVAYKMYQEDARNWMKYTISIDQYIELLTDDTGTIKNTCIIGHIYSPGGNGSCYYYFGDMFFENKTIYVAKAEEGATAISSNDNYVTEKRAYFAKGTEEIANFTGDYKGNAIRMTHYNGINLTVKNQYTSSELQEIKSKYNTVSIWMAVEVNNGKYLAFTEDEPGFILTAMKDTEHAYIITESKKWVKYSISVDDYISLLKDGDTCVLGSIYADGGNDVSYYYFGDMFFENIETAEQ